MKSNMSINTDLEKYIEGRIEMECYEELNRREAMRAQARKEKQETEVLTKLYERRAEIADIIAASPHKMRENDAEYILRAKIEEEVYSSHLYFVTPTLEERYKRCVQLDAERAEELRIIKVGLAALYHK